MMFNKRCDIVDANQVDEKEDHAYNKFSDFKL